MRKRYRVLLLAVLVAAFVVPVGFALSIDSTLVRLAHPVVVAPASLPSWSMPDAVKLFVIGTVLFGLAAAVRKSS